MVNIVSLGVTNLIDDAIRPMCLVKLTISNAPKKFDSALYVNGLAETLGAQPGTNWIRIEGSWNNCGLMPSQSYEVRILIPEGSVGCRVSFKYTGSSLFKGRLSAKVGSVCAASDLLAVGRRWYVWARVGMPLFRQGGAREFK